MDVLTVLKLVLVFVCMFPGVVAISLYSVWALAQKQKAINKNKYAWILVMCSLYYAIVFGTILYVTSS